MTTPVPVERSPADVLRLVVATTVLLVLLGVEAVFGPTLVSFISELLRGLDAFPRGVLDAVVVLTRILVTVVFLVGAVTSLIRHRFRMLATMAAAGAVAIALYLLVDGLLDSTRVALIQLTDSRLIIVDEENFPTASGIALFTALLTSAAPWLARRGRRLGWLLLVGLAISRFVTSDVSFDTPVAFAVGWASGAAVLVLLGAPTRRATVDSVIDGLVGVGVPLADLEVASVDARGSVPYFGTCHDGTRVFVKVLGDDERSADILFRLYRRLIPRDLGDERPFSSLRRAVEHEALVALAAKQSGVRTPRLVGMAGCEPASFVLAYEAIDGGSLDTVPPAELTTEVVTSAWEQVAILREHRIAHRDLRLANLFLAGEGEVWLIDFGFSEIAASDTLLATDLAELLTSLAVVIGADRSLVEARSVIGDEIAGAFDRLAPYALSGATRAAVKQDREVLVALRSGVHDGANHADPGDS